MALIAAHAGKTVHPDRLNPYRRGDGHAERRGKVAGFFGSIRAAIAAKVKRQGD